MPLSWGISHPARSIRVVAKDRIKHIELMNLMNAIDAAGANSYRKLVDFGRLSVGVSKETMEEFESLVRHRERTGKRRLQQSKSSLSTLVCG